MTNSYRHSTPEHQEPKSPTFGDAFGKELRLASVYADGADRDGTTTCRHIDDGSTLESRNNRDRWARKSGYPTDRFRRAVWEINRVLDNDQPNLDDKAEFDTSGW
jgi:hypothetical protein